MKPIKCYNCKVYLATKGIKELGKGLCDKCADRLLVAAIMADLSERYVKKNKIKKSKQKPHKKAKSKGR